MAIEKSQIAEIPDYTAAEQLKLTLYHMTQVKTSGVSYSQNGRSYTRANLKELQDDYVFWRGIVDTESSNSGRNTALADFSGQ